MKSYGVWTLIMVVLLGCNNSTPKEGAENKEISQNTSEIEVLLPNPPPNAIQIKALLDTWQGSDEDNNPIGFKFADKGWLDTWFKGQLVEGKSGISTPEGLIYTGYVTFPGNEEYDFAIEMTSYLRPFDKDTLVHKITTPGIGKLFPDSLVLFMDYNLPPKQPGGFGDTTVKGKFIMLKRATSN